MTNSNRKLFLGITYKLHTGRRWLKTYWQSCITLCTIWDCLTSFILKQIQIPAWFAKYVQSHKKAKRLFAVTHLLSPKNSQALGRVMWQGNVPNSADFMASNKIYAVFHVFGCFKFKFTFHTFRGISKPKKIYNRFWQQNMLNWVLLNTVSI